MPKEKGPALVKVRHPCGGGHQGAWGLGAGAQGRFRGRGGGSPEGAPLPGAGTAVGGPQSPLEATEVRRAEIKSRLSREDEAGIERL